MSVHFHDDIKGMKLPETNNFHLQLLVPPSYPTETEMHVSIERYLLKRKKCCQTNDTDDSSDEPAQCYYILYYSEPLKYLAVPEDSTCVSESASWMVGLLLFG